MNVKLLRKVQKHILAEPQRWSFSWAISSPQAPCGTRACIGGWTVILGKKIDLSTGLQFTAENNAGVASELLGLTDEERNRLFFYWPEPFLDRSFKYKTQEALAKNAANRIEHFIKTKGRE